MYMYWSGIAVHCMKYYFLHYNIKNQNAKTSTYVMNWKASEKTI